MKSLLIATLAATGLATCAFGSLGGLGGGSAAPRATQPPGRPRGHCRAPPGGVANALLRIVNAGNYPAQRCAPVTAHWLQIFPPNQTVPIYLHYTAQACAKPERLLTVNVVVPGSGG